MGAFPQFSQKNCVTSYAPAFTVAIERGMAVSDTLGIYVTDKVQTTNKVQSVIDKVQSGSAHLQGAPCR